LTPTRLSLAAEVIVRFVPAGVVVLAVTVLWLRLGTAGAELFRYAGWLTICILVPGVLLARTIRRVPRTGVEDLAVGFAFGSVLQVPVWWGCLRWEVSYWWWPAIVTVSVLVVPAARRRVLHPGLQRTPVGWSVAVAGVCLVSLGWLWGDFLRWTPAEPESHTYYGDLLFHLSVAGEVKRALPPTLPQVAGDPLYYHWFAHLDMAMASQGAGVELSTVVFQLWVPTTVLAGVVIVAASVTRLSGQLAAGPIAVVFIYAVGEVGLASWNVSVFLPMTQFYAWASPSQTAAALFTLPAVGVIVDFYRALPGGLRQLLLLGGPMLFGLALAKSSVLPVLIGAAFIVVLVQLRRDRPAAGRAVLVAGLLLLVFGVSVVLIYGGQGGGLALAPFETVLRYARAYLSTMVRGSAGAATHLTAVAGVAVIMVVWTVAVLGRLGGILLLIRGRRRVDIGLVFLIAGLVCGIGAYLMLSHPGGSQIYFLMSAFPLGAAASAWALAEHAPRTTRGCSVLAAVIVVLAVVAWRMTPLIGLPRTSEGMASQLAFIMRPTLVVAGAAGVLAAVLVVLHRLNRAASVSIATVVAVVVCAAGGATTLEYTFESMPSTGVARTRAEAPPSMATVMGDDVRAARWLRDHTTADTVVATNRHCVHGQVFPGLGPKPARCDVLSFWISAWTERRVLVEGWAFGHRAVELEKENGVTYKRQPFWNQALLKANDGFFSAPTAAKAAVLCRYGATYAILDRRYQPSLPSLDEVAERVHSTSTVEIYRLRC